MAQRILFVDDDSAFADTYREGLEAAGYEVTYEPQSDRAVATASKLKPDLIMLDLMMPVVSGSDVFKLLKANLDTKDIPVFILTALSGNSKLRESLTQEADDYLVKSEIDPMDLVRIVKKKLG